MGSQLMNIAQMAMKSLRAQGGRKKQRVLLRVEGDRTNERLWWTDEDKALFEELVGKVHVSVLMHRLGRSYASVLQYASHIGKSVRVLHVCRGGHQLEQRPSGKWVCRRCIAEKARAKRQEAKREKEANATR